jgi:hypothetical protein
MASSLITGKIISVGPSVVNQKTNSTFYRSLVFRDSETGQDINTAKCNVHDQMDRYITVGMEGDFLIKRTGIREFLAFRNGEEEKVDPRFTGADTGSSFKAGLMFWIGAAIAATVLLIIPGVMVMITAIIIWFAVKSNISTGRNALKKHNFSLKSRSRNI